MRQFMDFSEAFNEVKRDLAELSIRVHPETMQHFQVADNPDFVTRELYNYDYQVLRPEFTEVPGIHAEWVKQEWIDRLEGDLNPGRAWKHRKEVWEQMLEGRKHTGIRNKFGPIFAYSYSERMGGHHIQSIIDELKKHPNSRQLWLPVWYPIDETRRGERRVPCSLGYWFVQREGRLHITYTMRSCDFFTHMANDVCLATMLLHHVAAETGYEVGTFTHIIGSLHVYEKDVADVF